MTVLPAGGTLGTHDLLTKLWPVVLASLDVPEGAPVKGLTPAGMSDFLAQRCNNLSCRIQEDFVLSLGCPSHPFITRCAATPQLSQMESHPDPTAGQGLNTEPHLSAGGNHPAGSRESVRPHKEPSSALPGHQRGGGTGWGGGGDVVSWM